MLTCPFKRSAKARKRQEGDKGGPASKKFVKANNTNLVSNRSQFA